jgi:hypothetical protein
MPVVFMIMVHVLYLTSASSTLKVVTTWVSFLGVTLDLVSPWLITYISPVFVLTMLTGDMLMVIGFVIMFIVPMYEMWWRKSALILSKSEK